jgi:arabinose-5-phosphate isomerase
MDKDAMLAQARALIRAEGEALLLLAERLDDTFTQAVALVAECRGKVIVTGAGTSGAMAARLAHLLATCGMTAFYIPPGDALHGESAMLTEGDVLIAMSKAGKSQDINTFAKIARERGAAVMAWTAKPDSELAALATLVIQIEVPENAEGEGLLPFGSTLANGAFGDALTLLAKQLRGFSLATLAQTHPLGGAHELAQKHQGGGQ